MDKFQAFLAEYPNKSYKQGEPVKFAHFMRSGFAKVYITDQNNNETLIYFSRKNEVFPLDWIYSKTNISTCNYIAHTNCKVTLIPREDFVKFIRSDLGVLVGRHQMMIDIYLELAGRVYGLTQQKALDKILYALYYFYRRFEDSPSPSKRSAILPITQQEIASFVGLTRETVNANLGKLKKLGVILNHNQPGIKLSLVKLQKALTPSVNE